MMALAKVQPGFAGGMVDEGSQGPYNMIGNCKSFGPLCPGKAWNLATRADGSQDVTLGSLEVTRSVNGICSGALSSSPSGGFQV